MEFLRFIYLFERNTHRDFFCFHSSNNCNNHGQAKAKGKYQELLGPSCCSQVSRYLSHLPLLFAGHEQGGGSEVEPLGYQPKPIWDPSIADDSIAHCATVSSPDMDFIFSNWDLKQFVLFSTIVIMKFSNIHAPSLSPKCLTPKKCNRDSERLFLPWPLKKIAMKVYK